MRPISLHHFPCSFLYCSELPGAFPVRYIKLSISLFVVIAMTLLAPHRVRAETLVVQGSTTFNSRLMEPYQRVIETMSGVTLKVIPNKSQSGLISLLEGRADLAMISSSLESEIAGLTARFNQDQLSQLSAHLVDSTRVAFALHPSNPVKKASLDIVRKILTGQITSWRTLGGPDAPIRVVYSRSGGVTQTVQTGLLGGGPILAANQLPMGSGAQVIKVVAQEPTALGLSQLKLTAAHALIDLEVEEVIEQQLYLVSLGKPSSRATAVIDTARIIAQRRLATSEK